MSKKKTSKKKPAKRSEPKTEPAADQAFQTPDAEPKKAERAEEGVSPISIKREITGGAE